MDLSDLKEMQMCLVAVSAALGLRLIAVAVQGACLATETESNRGCSSFFWVFLLCGYKRPRPGSQ